MLPYTVTLMGLDKARSLRQELRVNQGASRLCLAALSRGTLTHRGGASSSSGCYPTLWLLRLLF